MGDQLRKYKRHEVERRLLAIKTFADEFAKQRQYAAALTIYEVLITEVIAHFNTYPDESITFSPILQTSIDGLDTCFAGEEDDPQIRLRVLKALFTIYRFFTDHTMDLDEDIPSLLVKNTTPQEREAITGWIRDAPSIVPVVDAAQTIHEQHIEHACHSYWQVSAAGKWNRPTPCPISGVVDNWTPGQFLDEAVILLDEST